MSVCLPVCVCVCVTNIASIHLKLEYIVEHENSSIMGIVQSRSWSQHDFEFFLQLPQYKLSSPISQLWHMLGSCD